MKEETKNLIGRPPIVVVMGHIDHGKTTLLDYIRKTSVASSETGGITQHIGAYEVDHGGKKITFLDTPGHEAFAKMRSRGARVADLAILVVAADDGVKPQTKEALETIKSALLPFAVAINKIDKPNANAEKVMGELAEAGVFLENRGGNVPYAEISAKQGTGVDRLLETILLLAELENITYNPKDFASGVVIESHRDSKRGVTSTLLVLNGTMKKGEYAVAGDAVSKIRILENFKGEAVPSAGASQPAVVVGFDKPPPVGAEFKIYFSQKEAADAARAAKETVNGAKKKITSEAAEKISFGLVIKSDVLGSAEAILHEIEKLKKDIKILRAEAGDVSEDDIKMAASSQHPFIVAFKVSASQSALEFAQRMNVEVAEFNIIYEVADWLNKKIEELAPKKEEQTILGRAKILKIFPAKGGVKGQIIGGEVIEGILRKNSLFNLLRRDKKIGEGRIDNLQQGRINMPEVGAGGEFGALATSGISIAEGDILEIFSAKGGSASGGE